MQFINGNWQPAQNNKSIVVLNPATEEPLLTTSFADHHDAILAINAAHDAFQQWRYTTPYERATILKKTADIIRQQTQEFALQTSHESGKPLPESLGEWNVAANLFEWFAEEAKRAYGKTIPAQKKDKRMHVIYQPMGVVGAITAWNFPVYNPARCWAAALAAGCTIVAKPSEFTPQSAFNLIKALQQAQIPHGVINLLIGDPDPIAQTFLNDPRLKKISFTGSTRVGKILLQGAHKTNTKLALEMGGNAPVIIMDDIDIPKVAQGLVSAKLRNCGQVCVSPQRIYVHEKIYQPFLEHTKKCLDNIVVGNASNPQTTLGPLINQKQKNHVQNLLQQASQEKNAQFYQHPLTLQKGFFVAPTIVSHISHNNPLCHNEIFGPIIPLIPFQSQQQAVQFANDTPYGLAAYIWTNNITNAFYFSEKIEAGLVGINEWVVQAVEGPFGGWKESGIGHECGTEGLLEYMEKKLISFGEIQ